MELAVPRMLTLLLCSGLLTQLLEKWILSEKEWEREKAMALHLHLMQIYVQSIGVCVSPGTPIPPPATLCCICRKCPHSLQGREHLSDQAPPQESLGKGQQRCASLGFGVGEEAEDGIVAWHGSRL